jgi:hypothetical protein
MTPERLDAIRADAADVEKRADRIATWRVMPHRFAVESGLRTQGLRAPRLAVHLRDLLAEVQRLQAEIERLRPRPSFCLDCLYDLPRLHPPRPPREPPAQVDPFGADGDHRRQPPGSECLQFVPGAPPGAFCRLRRTASRPRPCGPLQGQFWGK